VRCTAFAVASPASSQRQRFYTLETCPNFGEHFKKHQFRRMGVAQPVMAKGCFVGQTRMLESSHGGR
jgi:hypothetical protein